MNRKPDAVYRHSWNVRICHWINVVAVGFLVVSGLAILLDYLELYWGQVGFNGHEPAFRLADLGITMEGNRQWGRNMHFLFSWMFVINGIVYAAWNLLRAPARNKLLPRCEELRVSHLAAEVRDHLKLQAPAGERARQYNTLQKLAYMTVIFIVAPVMVLSGLAQSPALVAAFPDLLTVFGGKQSARSIHFIGMLLLMLFVLVHVFQVFVAGAPNGLRAMVTGWLVVPGRKRWAYGCRVAG